MGKKQVKKETEEQILKKREMIEKLSRKQQEKIIKTEKKIRDGKVYIKSTYNNTILTLTDLHGNVLAWVTAGGLGFKGPKKSTSYAASKVAEILAEKIKKIGIDKIAIFVKGIGAGRDSAIRTLNSYGLNIISIADITPIPHNGCRPPKVRRV